MGLVSVSTPSEIARSAQFRDRQFRPDEAETLLDFSLCIETQIPYSNVLDRTLGKTISYSS